MKLSMHYAFLLLFLSFFALLSALYYYSLVDLKTFRTIFNGQPKDIEDTIVKQFHIPTENFPAEAFEFSQVALELELKIFVIEPCILWKTTPGKERTLLRKRLAHSHIDKDCSRTTNGLSLTTFGIFLSDLPLSSLILKLEDRGFSSANYAVEDILEGSTLHFVAKKHRALIHLVTFTPRKRFLYIYPFKELVFGLKQSDLRFGHQTSAFDSIELEYNKINGIKVILPKERKYFMFEMKYSRFLECQHKLSDVWKSSFVSDDKTRQRARATVNQMRHLIKETTIPMFLDGGSLLGWARHCGEIPHEEDADFATFAKFSENKYDLAVQLVKKAEKPWYFIELFGFPWAAFEMRLYHSELRWQVDLFFLTVDSKNSSKMFTGYHTHAGVFFFKYMFEAQWFDEICSAEVHGMKVMVPCEYHRILKREYGPDWVVPDKKHVLLGVGKASYWPENLSYYAYQCLGRNHFNIRHYKYDANATGIQGVSKKKKAKMSKPVEDLVTVYKTTCARLRRINA